VCATVKLKSAFKHLEHQMYKQTIHKTQANLWYIHIYQRRVACNLLSLNNRVKILF